MGDSKAILTAKFIEIKSYIKKKKEMSKINNITLHLRNQKKTKLSPQLADRTKKKIRAETNEIENRKKIEMFDKIELIFLKG